MKLFGTDGIREVANTGPLTPEGVVRLGLVVGRLLREAPDLFRARPPVRLPKLPGRRARRCVRPTVLFGRDTRVSGPLLSGALAAGLLAQGIDVLDAGVLPTPAVAYLARKLGCVLGAVFSASHNPFEDNGIKFFSAAGLKIPDEAETRIEDAMDTFEGEAPAARSRLRGAELGRFRTDDSLPALYCQDVIESFRDRVTLDRMTVVLDCANGATSVTAPRILRGLGAQLVILNDQPNGTNINEHCGALFPLEMSKWVWGFGAQVGFSFDGDGDRLILTDETGATRDGDYILYMTALPLARRHKLPRSTVVTTVMANMGLVTALRNAGLATVTTPVGDRHVLDAMVERGLVLGGEQSGHVIFLDESTSGDGIITALRVLEAAQQQGRTISEICTGLTKFPQLLVNVPVRSKPPLELIPEVQEEVARIQATLGGRGRIVLRYSGTEPLVRVMLEGEDADAIQEMARRLARILERRLGS